MEAYIGATQSQSPRDGQRRCPPLQPGDYLTRAEFERRYHAHPEIKKAELIEAIVYMPSPIRADQHGDPHFDLITWLGMYRVATSGIRGSDNATLRLDLKNEPQPDVMLRLESALGGTSRIDSEGYVEGPPELIGEIAASSASYDLNQKKDVYARHGVQEYLVVQMYERALIWFTLREGVYQALEADAQGTLRSEVFPGLWLQPDAFWNNDMVTVLAVLQEGLVSPEHTAFVARLQAHG